jgi:hypothetical protein
MENEAMSEKEPPFQIGAKLRYWLVTGTYRQVRVLSYTKTGRVRVEPIYGGRTLVVKSTSLSIV